MSILDDKNYEINKAFEGPKGCSGFNYPDKCPTGGKFNPDNEACKECKQDAVDAIKELDKAYEDSSYIKIFVWPDYSWCYKSELESKIASGSSDDYAIITVPEELSYEAIDRIVIESKCQDTKTNKEV